MSQDIIWAAAVSGLNDIFQSFDSDIWVLVGPMSTTHLFLCSLSSPIISWVLHQPEPTDLPINGHKQNIDWTGNWGTTRGLPSFYFFGH